MGKQDKVTCSTDSRAGKLVRLDTERTSAFLLLTHSDYVESLSSNAMEVSIGIHCLDERGVCERNPVRI